ncbi:UNVERIFIED_CONTAM: putative coatomer subunit delta, partial [Eudyptes robustus]
VLIAAAIYSKNGKLLLCRQFLSELTKARLQGLVDTFPKLVISEKNQKEHTYVETDSVRYVYQPMDKIYLALITTKTSNIMEDLDCLRLFARIIPEYC